MLEIIPLLLTILPLLFQIIYGRKAIGEDIKLKFRTICLISFISQILMFYISFSISSNFLERRIENGGFECGMGILGVILFSLLFSFLLLTTMIIQFFIKKSYSN